MTVHEKVDCCSWDYVEWAHKLSYSGRLNGEITCRRQQWSSCVVASMFARQTASIKCGPCNRALHTSFSFRLNTGPLPQHLCESQHVEGSFQTTGYGLEDGLNLPTVNSLWHALKMLALPVFLSYVDIGTDLYTAVNYYKSGHIVWCILGLVFALLPGFIVAIIFLSGSGVAYTRRLLVALQLSVLVEAFNTLTERVYSPTLALVRVAVPLFEAVPQLLLQIHAILVLWRENSPSPNPLKAPFQSVFISIVSLAYAATDIASVEELQVVVRRDQSASNWCTMCSRPTNCWLARLPWSVTELAFGRAPTRGEFDSGYLGMTHPQTLIWACFLYHIFEVVSRFIPLAFLILLMRSWFVGVLAYLWLSRCALVGLTAWQQDGRKGRVKAARDEFSRAGFRVRVVAMPFLDSVVVGEAAFRVSLGLTLVEFVVCTAIYHAFPSSELDSYEQRAFTIIAAACLAGKMLLALLVIVPLKNAAAKIIKRDEAQKRKAIEAAKGECSVDVENTPAF